MEVLRPGIWPGTTGLVSEETEDPGMLARPTRAAQAAPVQGQGSSSGTPGRELAAGHAAATGLLISRPTSPEPIMIMPVTRPAVCQLRTETADMGDVRAACPLKSSSADSAGSVSAAAGQFIRLRHGEIVTGATGA
jgi:hypothetical protein